MFDVLLKQRLEMLMETNDAPVMELERTRGAISHFKKKTRASEHEAKLIQGLLLMYMYMNVIILYTVKNIFQRDSFLI
jgi:hypothetical protein